MVNQSLQWWQPSPDHLGQIQARVRFLPGLSGGPIRVGELVHELPLPNKTFRVPCSESCKLCTLLDKLVGVHATDTEILLARYLQNDHVYIANVLVIDDPVHIENNGQVCLYCYDSELEYVISRRICDLACAVNHRYLDTIELITNYDLIIVAQQTNGGWWDYYHSYLEPHCEVDQGCPDQLHNRQRSLHDVTSTSVVSDRELDKMITTLMMSIL